jgi:hypothetical protein
MQSELSVITWLLGELNKKIENARCKMQAEVDARRAGGAVSTGTSSCVLCALGAHHSAVCRSKDLITQPEDPALANSWLSSVYHLYHLNFLIVDC